MRWSKRRNRLNLSGYLTGSTLNRTYRTLKLWLFHLYILLAQDVLRVKPRVVRDKHRLNKLNRQARAAFASLGVRARALRAAGFARSHTALPMLNILLVARLGR